MSAITPAVYTALSSKNSWHLCEKLEADGRKECAHSLAMPGWVLWSHLEYVDEKCWWKKCYCVVMAVFLLPLFPAVVATKYLAGYLVFLKGWKCLLIKKKKRVVLSHNSEKSCDCVACATSVRNS